MGVVESYKDITSLKRYEDEIKKGQERALAFFKGNPVPCYIWKRLDNDFVLDNYNDAAYEITQGEIADLIGKRFSRFYEDNPDFIHDIWSCFKEKKGLRREMHYRFKSFAQEKDFIIIYSYIAPDSVLVHTEDITMHVDVLIKVVLRLRVPLVDLEVSTGERIFAYSLVPFPESGYVNLYGQDVTTRKKAEELLEKDKNVLKKVVDRKEAQLLETSKQLQDAKRFSDLGVLAATIAHELRNPFGVIRSAVYNINRKNSNAALKSHLLNIEKKVSESDQIICNLLSYSKINFPHRARVSIVKILDECALHCAEKYIKWQVEVHKDIAEGVDMIDADLVHMTELFCNILDNAYQAFPEKKGMIKITAGYEEEKRKIRIVFEDNGIGMEEADLKKAFEPFFTKKHRGIGLGLSVCAQVVRLHGGTIEIKSRPREGARVIVVLPTS